MASLPSPTQVAGSHWGLFEAFYHMVDATKQGTIGAIDAAKFLKKSGLSDAILSKVWDLSDPTGRGYLDKNGLFVALKLVSLAQNGKEVTLGNLSLDMPPPQMGEVPPSIPTSTQGHVQPAPVAAIDWSMKPTEKAKYDQLFDSLQPINGKIEGNKVKGLMLDSKLPMETLGKIWDLADMDKDGMLDRDEFSVAMHLVYKALEKYTIPSSLPPELLPMGKRKNSAYTLPGAVPVLPNLIPGIDGTIPPIPQASPWVVSAEEKTKYDILFKQTDLDHDGFVSGTEIKDVFLQSGVPQAVLAHIWNLCDMKQTGKLSSEQFALAMWLISQKLKGIEPPQVLTPEMIPPTLRPKPGMDSTLMEINSVYSNPELEMISKEINELSKEKRVLEAEISQKEVEMKIKNGEIKSLQSEFDTLAATLKQLENQKGEAQKRLNDLDTQKESLEKEVSDLRKQLEAEQEKVSNLQKQAEEQEKTLRIQEEEVSSRQKELNDLQQEERQLEEGIQDSVRQLDNLTKNLQNTQLQISQSKAKLSNLQEQQRQMNDAISLYDSAISSGDASSVSDASLRTVTPDFCDPEFLQFGLTNGGSPPIHEETVKAPETLANPVAVNEEKDPFVKEDLFANDPFKNTTSKGVADPFAAKDDFEASFAVKDDFFKNDPFAPLGSTTAKNDPFDPFGLSGKAKPEQNAALSPGKDPFGCDPFSAPTAPPPRPESPCPPPPASSAAPALPPKKSKQPPPRPAPPKATGGGGPAPGRPAGPVRAAPAPPPHPPPPHSSDPFGGGAAGGGFADFANFDSKFSAPGDSASATLDSNLNFTKNNNNNNSSDSTWFGPKPEKKKKQTRSFGDLDFSEDPFKNYRYDYPLDLAHSEDNDPFKEDDDPFVDGIKLGGGGDDLPPLPKSPATSASEDEQLVWAATESLRLEEERKSRAAQEEADLEYALAISKAEVQGAKW